jgi:hypothetical protein
LSDELVQVQPSLPAVPESGDSSWGADSDVVKPRYIQIKNPKSVVLEDFKNGYFVDKEVERQWPEIEIVILSLNLTRKWQEKYQQGQKGGRKVFCRSNNRVEPVKDDTRFTPAASSCDVCPQGRRAWAGYDRASKTGKPDNPCEEGAEILFIIKSNPHQPYIFDAQMGSRTVIENLNKKLKNRAVDVKQATGRMPFIYEYVVTLKTERSASGNYDPVVSSIRELTKEEAAEFGPVYNQFVVQRKASFEAYKQAKQLEERSGSTSGKPIIEEVPAQEATKPVINAEYMPPVKKTTAERPVYVPPAAELETIEAEIIEAGDVDAEELPPTVNL